MEYGTDCLEMHVATAHPEEWALVIENLVATNGTLSEATRLFGKLRTISYTMWSTYFRHSLKYFVHSRKIFVLVE